MPTDTDKKLNGTPEPFRRPVVWGRPPATVFRAGPLPKGGTLPPLPEPPRRATGHRFDGGHSRFHLYQMLPGDIDGHGSEQVGMGFRQGCGHPMRVKD